MNYDASTSENNLKFFAKMPGEHTQKGTKMQIVQTCIRLRETDLMMKAISTYKHSYPSHFKSSMTQNESISGPVPNDHDAVVSVLVGSPHFTVTVSPVDGQSQVKRHQGLKARTEREVHPILIKFLVKLATTPGTDFFGQNIFEIYTEYKRNHRIIWAHPNYNSFGEWYDWVMVKFASNPVPPTLGHFEGDLYPCKVIGYTKDRDNKVHAIVHACAFSDHQLDSVLIERWQKQMVYDIKTKCYSLFLHIVETDSFDLPVYVVEDLFGLRENIGETQRELLNGVSLVIPHDLWAEKFH